MNNFRSRILREILWAPSVIMPLVAGASSWLISWAVGGVTALNVAGLVLVILGVGWLGTRAIFLPEQIAAKVVREDLEKALKAEEEKLDQLQFRLRSDRDYRTKDYLTLLRTCRSEFETFAGRPGIAIQSHEIIKQVRQLFWAAIDQLEQSLKLYHLSERLNGEQRAKILAQREDALNEIRESIEHMQSAVKHYQEMMNRETNNDLNELRDELDASLRIAKRTEERMRELEGSVDYGAFLKE